MQLARTRRSRASPPRRRARSRGRVAGERACRAAAAALDGSLAVEGLDGRCVGFNDLAGAMGLSGQVTDPRVVAVTEEVIDKTRQPDKPLGSAMGLNARD